MGLSINNLIVSQACSSCFYLEQMNEGDEAIVTTVGRKKKRRSGFRFSSRKALERSRLKRETTKACGYQFESVTRALTYPSEICDIVHHDCAVGSSHHLALIVYLSMMELE